MGGAWVGRVSWVLVLIAILAVSGCTTVKQTGTQRSSIEQRLLVRALERAVRRMDTEAFRGRRVDVRLYGLTTDQTFAQEFVASRLALRGIHVVRAGEPSDTVMRVFATALAVDMDTTLFGLPAMQAPVLAVPIPEIALFKVERSRGHAEMEMYLYDDDGYFTGALPDAFGQSTYRRFTILIVISFATGDLKKPGQSED